MCRDASNLTFGLAILGVTFSFSVYAQSGSSDGPGHGSAGHGATAHGEPSTGLTSTFSTDVSGLPVAKPMSVVELKDGATFVLTAAPVKQKIAGRWVRRLAYNGSIPGPLIKLEQGASVKITLKNEMDVETTLHPHGLRIDDRNDGVVGIGQKAAVPPGGSHDYTLRFPDVGMFWYHPHVREDYAQDLGLYGNFWVVPQAKDFYAPVHREMALLLDDATVKDAPPYFRDKVTHTLMGRYGNVMLVNGVDDFKVDVMVGEIWRFYITNTANTRTFQLAIPGVRMKLVGGDNGLYEHEAWLPQGVTIGPSERYIVEAQFQDAGEYSLVNDKGGGAKTPLGRIKVRLGAKPAPLAGDFSTLRSPAAAKDALSIVKTKLAKAVDFDLRILVSMDHQAMPMVMNDSGASSHDKNRRAIEWDDDMASMNRASDDKNLTWRLVDQNSKAENMAINWTFKKGQFVKIRIINDATTMHPMQHPIHFHGQRFVIASVNGRSNDNLVWKDSVLIAPGETTDLVLEATNVGRWMAHCHIAEHLGAGMMLGFQVID